MAQAAPDSFFPQFHVRPSSNWINDPNGPFYDPMHKKYHLFNQYNPFGSSWGHMSWSHSVSSDLVHWERLPVALWPNQSYDASGVFSGSVTLVGGDPVISYTCVGPGGQLQCLARPSNRSDPNLVEWSKDSRNPVIAAAPPGGSTKSFRDDTTAWQDAAGGAWSMAMGAAINGSAAIALYTSKDFETFAFQSLLWTAQQAGPAASGMFECPDFFKSGEYYVAKVSSLGQDWLVPGTFDASSGHFSALPGAVPRVMDLHKGVYASKSFYDPIGKQQIMWSWVRESDNGAARGWQSTNSLPRVMAVDAELKVVTFSPLTQLQQLRGAPMASWPKRQVPVGEWVQVVEGVDGMQQEFVLSLTIPPSTHPTTITLALRAPPPSHTSTTSQPQGTLFSLQSMPETGPMNNTDRPGGDYRDYGLPASAGAAKNIANCSAQCALESQCVAWTYVREGGPSEEFVKQEEEEEEKGLGSLSSSSPSSSSSSSSPPPSSSSPPRSYPVPRCSLKSSIPKTNYNQWCVSGTPASLQLVKDTTNAGGDGDHNVEAQRIPLKASEDNTTLTVDLHAFVDHSIVEVFAFGGRAVGTARVYPPDQNTAAYLAVNATVPITINSLIAYPIANIYD